MSLLEVERDDHDLIRASWKIYFSLFSDAMCKERNKPIASIARTEIKLCVADIVNHLRPWSFNSPFPVTFGSGDEGGGGDINKN